jgi:broad specificity phosphatase PhoE
MLRLYLIRHAEPESTWGGGDPDPGLSEKGRRQAEAARDALLALPDALRPERVVSSPLRRCRETAERYAEAIGAEVVIDPRVGEIPAPSALSEAERGPWLRRAFEGRWSEIEGDIDYGRWRRDVVAALAGHRGAAVFSHYVAINAALSFAAGEERVHHARPDHASLHVLDALADGSLTLVEQGREAATQVLL